MKKYYIYQGYMHEFDWNYTENIVTIPQQDADDEDKLCNEDLDEEQEQEERLDEEEIEELEEEEEDYMKYDTDRYYRMLIKKADYNW